MSTDFQKIYQALIDSGLSENEIQTALENTSFKAVSLGPRILRTETAALSAISILQATFGDI